MALSKTIWLTALTLTAALLPVVRANEQSIEYSLRLRGPRSVVQGRSCFISTSGDITKGVQKRATAYVSGLPPGATATYIWNITRYAEPPRRISLTDGLGIKITTSPDTPIGDDYNIVVTYDVTGGDGNVVTQSVATPFAVLGMPEPLVKSPMPRDVPLPSIKGWEQNMRRFADKHLARDRIGCCGAFGEVWYYDGARAFLQIADYTGEQKYLDFARRINQRYRDYINETGGRGFARFPHGLKMFYEREGDQLSRDAVGKLQQHSFNALRPQWNTGFLKAREMAYSLSGHVLAEQLGFDRLVRPKISSDLLEEQVAIVMGHFEQWFVSETAEFTYPFMVGLGAEALIDYYEVSKDPLVPWLLKLAADKMYLNPETWHEGTESMMIVEDRDGKVVRGPAPDLNMMIAPLYGWVFQQTGDVKYREIGDRIFTSGAKRAYLDGGKQFTQNYRWSFKYVEWRTAHSQPAAGIRRRR